MFEEFIKTFINIQSVIHPRFTRGFLWIVFFGLIIAILDLFGISLIFYVISIAMNINAETFHSNLLPDIFLNSQYHQYSILFAAILVLMLYALKNGIILIFNKKQLDFAFHVGEIVSQRRYEKIIQEKSLYFSKEKSTDIINEIIGAGVLLPEHIIIPSIVLVSELLLIILVGLALSIYNPLLFLFILMIFVPSIFLIFYFNQKKLKYLGRNIHLQMPLVYDNILQFNKGIDVVKLWGAEGHFVEGFRNIRNTLYQHKKKLHLNMHFIPIRVFEMVAIFGIVVLIFYAFFSNNILHLTSILAIYAAVAFRILPSINRLIGSSNQIISNKYIFDNFRDFNFEAAPQGSIKKDLIFQKKLTLENIQFRYTQNQSCLEKITLVIKKGAIVGIIGKNGEGKTTLLKIICGIIMPDKGKISVDDLMILEDDINSYYDLFSYIGQDPFITLGTIKENIQFFREDLSEDADKRIWNILKQVGLEDFVKKLPAGLETKIGENGKNLSGGQKQKLAIARALYKNTQIFICDEITNGLDSESVSQLLTIVKALSEAGKTIIISSHIQTDLKLCEFLYEINNGILTQKHSS